MGFTRRLVIAIDDRFAYTLLWLIGKLELIPLTQSWHLYHSLLDLKDPNFSNFAPFDYVSYSLLGTVFTLHSIRLVPLVSFTDMQTRRNVDVA